MLAGCAFAMGCGGAATGPASGADPDDPDFRLEIRYWGERPTDEQAAVIEAAAVRWEQLIRSGLPDAAVSGDIGCGPSSPPLEGSVDDVVVYVRVIDLPALAESGPCKVRQRSGLPITATVWLDGPSRLNQLSLGFLETLVQHELAHALGFGTLWKSRQMLQQPALMGGQDPHFVGSSAIAAFDGVGGAGYGGAKVPVESDGGPGSADSHWREDVFGSGELMTATVFSGPNALSAVTASSIGDLGYDVDVAQADPFALPDGFPSSAALPRLTPASPRLTESPPRWSISVTDPAGAIVRTLEPR